MHLRNDHALSAVDDKRTLVCHQRDIAHKHVLFLDVVHGFRARGFVHVKYDQAQRRFYRRRVCQIALHALFDIVLRLRQFVLDKLQHAVAGKVADGENGFKYFFQTELAMVAVHVNVVDKAVVRTGLNLNQAGHVDNGINPPEIFSYTFLARIRFFHLF